MKEKINNFNENQESEVTKIFKMNPGQLGEYFKSLDLQQASQMIDTITKTDEGVAYLSYWEKYLDKDKQILLDKTVHQIQEHNKAPGELPLNLEQRFNENELKVIFQKIRSIQLSYGCSKGCTFCGFDAVAKVRQSIPYSQLENLFKKYGAELAKSRPFLYYASEPSDYQDQTGEEKKVYQDVHQLAENYAHYSPHVTSVKLSDDWLGFMKEQTNRPRLSVFKVKSEKTQDINSKLESKVELVGQNSEQYDDIGKNFYNLSEQEKAEAYKNQKGIGCFNGFLMTPRGLYNVFRLQGPTEDFPQGQMVIPFKEFKDVEIKVGDNIINLLPYYVIHLSGQVYFGNKEEICLILRKKTGEKIILFVDGQGQINKQIDFDKNFRKFDTNFVVEQITASLNDDKLVLDSTIKFFSSLSNEEILTQLQDNICKIKTIDESQIEEGLLADDREWNYVVSLSAECLGHVFSLSSKKQNNVKILSGLTFYFDIVNGQLKKTYLHYDSQLLVE